MGKWAAVYSTKESSWVSCQVITPNLIKTYRKAFGDDCFESFHFSTQSNKYDNYKLFNGLKELDPEKIIFLDHQPHPGEVVKFIHKVKNGKNLPELVFHLFGDFTLFTDEWIEIAPLLKDFKVKFIAASQRQCQLVSKFLNLREGLVHYLPFPVDETIFSFDPKIKQSVRERLGFKKSEDYILYTGRLSAQKNINQMVKIFDTYKRLMNPKANLLIAGQFDDMGFPFFGKYPPEGYNFRKFEEIISEFSASVQESITFLGSLNAESLNEYYNACDVFFSLSLHNDEDYGMSPAEAFVCGMPLVLSSWGGYASFEVPEEKTYFIKVQNEDSFYKVNSSVAMKSLMSATTKQFADEDRERLSNKAKEKFSITGASSRLKNIFKREQKHFTSWNSKMQLFCDCFIKRPLNPFSFDTGVIEEGLDGNVLPKMSTRKIYQDVYHEYTVSDSTEY